MVRSTPANWAASIVVDPVSGASRSGGFALNVREERVQLDPAFISEYNRLRQKTKESTMAQVAQLEPVIDALEDILDSLEARDRLGAVKLVLQTTGALEPDRIGSTDR